MGGRIECGMPVRAFDQRVVAARSRGRSASAGGRREKQRLFAPDARRRVARRPNGGPAGGAPRAV
ncbi:hypothetical protein WS68_21325 [Burkholderia sp. TSV86]|nr:hypothetical protein WS68_21325 [Burkholderia sp. TSV86]